MSRLQGMDKNKTYLVYCIHGGMTARAVAEMDQQGFQKIIALPSGIASWANAGYPIKQ